MDESTQGTSPATTDPAERYEEIHQAIKSLAVERDRLAVEHASADAIADVLNDIKSLADEGNAIARVVRTRREAATHLAVQRAEQAGDEALADLDARYAAERARIAQRRVEQ